MSSNSPVDQLRSNPHRVDELETQLNFVRRNKREIFQKKLNRKSLRKKGLAKRAILQGKIRLGFI